MSPPPPLPMPHALWEPCPPKVGQHSLMGAGRGWGARRAAPSSPPSLPTGSPARSGHQRTHLPQAQGQAASRLGKRPVPGQGWQVHGAHSTSPPNRLHQHWTLENPTPLAPRSRTFVLQYAPHCPVLGVAGPWGRRARAGAGSHGQAGPRQGGGPPALGLPVPTKSWPPALLGLPPEVLLQGTGWPAGGSRAQARPSSRNQGRLWERPTM